MSHNVNNKWNVYVTEGKYSLKNATLTELISNYLPYLKKLLYRLIYQPQRIQKLKINKRKYIIITPVSIPLVYYFRVLNVQCEGGSFNVGLFIGFPEIPKSNLNTVLSMN